MSDLFLPPMAPTTPLPQFSLQTDMGPSFAPPTPLQRYSMYDVAEEEDPTLAWVRALPSPSLGGSGPTGRLLETPRPVLDQESRKAMGDFPKTDTEVDVNENSSSKLDQSSKERILYEAKLIEKDEGPFQGKGITVIKRKLLFRISKHKLFLPC